MNSNFYNQLLALQEELSRNEHIELLRFEINEGLSDFDIRFVEDEVQCKIPEDLKGIYKEVSSVDYLWVLKDDTKIHLLKGDDPGHVNGKGCIMDFYTMFMGNNDNLKEPWKNMFWFEESMDSEVIEENKLFRPFDFYDNYESEAIGYLYNGGSLSETLYLRNSRGSLLSFDLNVKQYMDNMLRTKGFVNWQEDMLFNDMTGQERMKYYLSLLFR